MPTVDLAKTSLRELNHALHQLKNGSNETAWEVINPNGSAINIATMVIRKVPDNNGQIPYCRFEASVTCPTFQTVPVK